MTSGNSEKVSSLNEARGYIERAQAWLRQLPGFPDTPEHVTASAVVGIGMTVLALAEVVTAQPASIELAPSCSPLPPELQAAIRRSVQAAAEARPHDDESGFLGITRHGHPIGSKTIPPGNPLPNAVARCGGPAICPECSKDAAVIKELRNRG